MKQVHREHEIIFDEESEEWKCGTLALADTSLKRLKAAIDREAKARRRVNVPAYWLTERRHKRTGLYGNVLLKVTIVLLREGGRKVDAKVDGERGQHQVDISEVYSQEQKPLLEKYIDAKERQQKADDEASLITDRLVSMTAEDVREAVAQQADKET